MVTFCTTGTSLVHLTRYVRGLWKTNLNDSGDYFFKILWREVRVQHHIPTLVILLTQFLPAESFFFLKLQSNRNCTNYERKKKKSKSEKTSSFSHGSEAPSQNVIQSSIPIIEKWPRSNQLHVNKANPRTAGLWCCKVPTVTRHRCRKVLTVWGLSHPGSTPPRGLPAQEIWSVFFVLPRSTVIVVT